jgi:hypothetical protein
MEGSKSTDSTIAILLEGNLNFKRIFKNSEIKKFMSLLSLFNFCEGCVRLGKVR